VTVSAAPVNLEDIPAEAKSGIIAAIIGGLAMTARLLLSTTPVSPGWVARRVLAAGITSAIAGYALTDYITSPGLRMGAIGAIGYSAPEALDYLMAFLKKRAEKEIGKVETNAKESPAPKVKRKPAKRRC
jgi:hypothetical protein